ncbi:MAG TPA: MFS transporter [Candidatus Baltobacteraceae bacterium]|jgi:MFS family permease|nr:MFS transporter [Candidatus Baltobacteraceae bacterium]
MIERRPPQRDVSLFSSLRFRDFRLLWFGLLISNLGSWMQLTATGYFIAKLAGNPHTASLYLGFQGVGRAIPVLLLSPLAGLVADTLPRRRILYWTNAVMSLLALILAIFTSLGWMNIVGLILINSANAAAMSFDSPARQSWVPLMVPREYIGNAIGLNSVAFNAPAVIGPAVAGILIASIGIAGSFYVNAVATLAVVVALMFMKPAPPSTSTANEPFLRSIAQGLRFLFGHKILGAIITVFIVTALLVRPYGTLLPAFVVNTLHGNAKALGIAIAATGVGGFAGALLTAYLGARERRGIVWGVSAIVMSAGVLALGFIWNVLLSLPVLFVIGTATLTFLGASNTLIQTLSPDDVRGRAISVYTMVALGLVPGGALIVGGLGSALGLHAAFWIVGAVCAVVTVWLWLTRPVLNTV